MGRQRVWRIAPENYEAMLQPLRATGLIPVEVPYPDRSPCTVFAVEMSPSLADDMGRWCAENEFPARVVRTATIQFIELYDAIHAVLFKIRWV
jgi:hypothetical protein